nr:MAG TPA: hypothetical protein [Caudoviricetes sp.]
MYRHNCQAFPKQNQRKGRLKRFQTTFFIPARFAKKNSGLLQHIVFYLYNMR